MEIPTVLEFNCPVCGKDNRLGKLLSDQVKDAGWMRKDLNFYVSKIEGVVSDPMMESRKPIGSKTPAFCVSLDICLDCGCFYAAKVEIGEAVKGLPPVIQKGKIPPFSS